MISARYADGFSSSRGKFIVDPSISTLDRPQRANIEPDFRGLFDRCDDKSVPSSASISPTMEVEAPVGSSLLIEHNLSSRGESSCAKPRVAPPLADKPTSA